MYTVFSADTRERYIGQILVQLGDAVLFAQSLQLKIMWACYLYETNMMVGLVVADRKSVV